MIVILHFGTDLALEKIEGKHEESDTYSRDTTNRRFFFCIVIDIDFKVLKSD